uniref:Ig-like domain-containing protein n=1 Tax=Electrophorus electricus TaxID=8005 RepID=A0A4W4E8Z7_ELEEL
MLTVAVHILFLISEKVGDTVSVHCNISFNVETVWVRQRIDRVPEGLLVSGPNEHDGSVYLKNRLDPRFSAVVNHSSQTNNLQIRDISNDDLALYYCIGRIRGKLTFGVGTRLYLSEYKIDVIFVSSSILSGIKSNFYYCCCQLCFILTTQSLYVITALPKQTTLWKIRCMEVRVSVGSTAILPCYSHVDQQLNSNNIHMQWKKGDTIVLDFHDGKMDRDLEYSFRTTVEVESVPKGDFSLSITDTKTTDSGVYKCLDYYRGILSSIILDVYEVTKALGNRIIKEVYVQISSSPPKGMKYILFLSCFLHLYNILLFQIMFLMACFSLDYNPLFSFTDLF